MPDQHLPGAELHQLDDAPMVGDGGARVIWHITWDKNATASAPADLVPFANLTGYFAGGGSGVAPHILWDPFTGRFAQFFSATSRSKSVVNAAGGVETNRKGNVCIQIETLFFPYCRVNGKVYPTLRDTPCLGLDRLMVWLRSWGVPDVWPMGAPTWSANRNATTWNTRSGHYGHSQVPENDHTDPGPMPDLFAAPTEEDPLMAFTEADLRRFIREEAGGVGVRDNVAFAVLYWLNLALRGQVPQAAIDQKSGWVTLVPQLHEALGQLQPATRAALQDALGAALAEKVVNVHVDVNATPTHNA